MFKTLLIITFITCFVYHNSSKIVASVDYDEKTNKFTILQGVNDSSKVATAEYEPTLNEIGWDKLKVTTDKSDKYDDAIKAYSAGFIEGFITSERISSHFLNMKEITWKQSKGQMPDTVRQFLIDQSKFLKDQYYNNPTDPYWSFINNISMQYEGLVDGYNSSGKSPITKEEFHVMASSGDLSNIIYYKNKPSRPNFSEMSELQIMSYIHKTDHCSALIKIAPDFSDIWFGHNTWASYSSMTRIFKEYNFKFSNPLQVSESIVFSSYAGNLASDDDFYVTGQNLAVMETTNTLFNTDLWDALTPNSILTWQRAMLSNWISSDSKSWTYNFAKHNSGTYNNQYMVLDLKKVDTKNKKLLPDALWIIEQIPETTVAQDVTEILSFGYWASYNTPYSAEIRKLSLIEEQIAKHKDLAHELDYYTCARSEIFRREQGRVNSLEDFKLLMRYNNYKTDPLSLENASLTISSRIDFLPSDELCGGALDAKVLSIHDIVNSQSRKIHIVGSPTFNSENPVFEWAKSVKCKDEPHHGINEILDFEWTTFESTSVSLNEKKKLESLRFLS